MVYIWTPASTPGTGPTGSEIRLAVNARMNLTKTADQLDSEITAALRLISGMAKWPDLHKTDTTTLAFSSGNKSKALPTDCRIADRLYLADDSTLLDASIDWIRQQQETASPATGDPIWKAIIGGSVYVYPIPDSSVTVYLDYWCEPADVEDESLNLILGYQFKEAIVLGTILQYIKGLGFTSHPKLADTERAFAYEMAKLDPLRDEKPLVAKAYEGY